MTIKMTREEYAAKFGQPPPIAAAPTSTPQQGVGESIGNFAKGALDLIPGKQLGDEIGNSISALGGAASYALHGKFGDAAARLQSGVESQHPVKTVADTVQAVATPASLAFGGPATAGVKSALGRAAVNTGFGEALAGANTAAQGGNFQDTLKSAAVGGITGAAGSALFEIPGAINAAKQAKIPQAVDSLEAKYRELAGTTTKTSKLLSKSNKATEAKNLAGTTGKPVERTLAEAGVIPRQDPLNPSRLSTVDQADEFRKGIQPLHDVLKDGIKAISYSVPPTPIDALETAAIHRVVGQPLTEGDKITMIDGIKKEFGLLRSKHGDTMTIGEMADAKSPYWGKTKFDSTKPLQSDINYQIGKSFQKGVESAALKGGFEDVAQLNREIGDRLEAAKFLESMNGKIVKKGQLGKYALQGMGAIAGSSHGPLGSIVGGVIGDAAANMLISNAVAGPVKRMILEKLQRTDPAVYTKAVKWLEQHGQSQALQLKLPAGAKLGEPGNPHIVPPRETSSVTTVPAAKMPGPGMTESGKFTKVYGNSPEGALGTPAQKEGQAVSSDYHTNLAEKVKNVFADIKKNGNKGFVKLPGVNGKMPKIPQDDLATMSDFTDMIGGDYKPSAEMAHNLEVAAKRLHERYGKGKMPKTLEGLANDLGRILEAAEFKPYGTKAAEVVGQGRDKIGRYSKKTR